MKKRSLIPETRVKNPEPKNYNEDWKMDSINTEFEFRVGD